LQQTRYHDLVVEVISKSRIGEERTDQTGDKNGNVCIWPLADLRAMSDLSPLSGAKRKTLARTEYFAF
jgi:hypothetical protein